MDTTILRELGFTEREIKVYIALLELGKSTAGPIAIKAKLPQTKVYETLGKLIEKGLVSFILVSKTKHFQPCEPKQILNLIDQKKEQFKEILHELENKRKFGQEQQTAIIHEGYKAVKLLFINAINKLRKDDFYYAFALREAYKGKSAPDFFANVHHTLSERGIIDKALAVEEIREEIKENYKDNKNIQIKFIDFSLPIGVVILPDKIIQLSWSDLPTAIEIDSKIIARDYKNFFDDIWKQAKK